LFINFNAAAVEQHEIDEVNLRTVIEVAAATPIRRAAACLKPIRGDNGRVAQIVSDYLDCVRAVKVLPGGK
jgi:hypothetical protein